MESVYYRSQFAGRACEAIAISTLSSKGYEVYLGFGNTSCDMIAKDKDGKLYRIEVKRKPKGKYFPPFKKDKCDILIVADDSNSSAKFYFLPIERGTML